MRDVVPAGRRVLVVDDEYLVAGTLAEALAAAGIEVVGPAPSVKRALALLAGAPHLDLAVLDVNLAGEAVYPVADALRARGVPFVLVTGYDVRGIPERYRDALMLEKPIEADAVVTAIRPLLA